MNTHTHTHTHTHTYINHFLLLKYSELTFFLFNFIFYLSLPEDIQILSLFRKPSDLLMLKL